MSLTSISQIRNHLYRINVGEGEIRNRAVRMTTQEYSGLPHGHIVSVSETVKALVNTIPFSESVILGDGPAALSHQQLAANTVVCASDSSLSYLYQENLDYTVDYADGTISRMDDGAIPVDTEVVVWYLHYHIYQRGVDYFIDYERGRLRRVGSGNIEEGQEVLVDYRLGSSEFSDDEIDQCITEAEADIMRTIDAVYRDSTDPALQTAATCLTLSFLCRNAAGVSAAAGQGGDRQASVWIDLADAYHETARRLLTWFHKETPALRPPALT